MLTFSIDIPTVVCFLGGIPIQFCHGGKEYYGLFSRVQGAGATSVYHLTINQYYKGRLRLSAFNNRWVFDGEFAHKAEWFSEHISEYT